MASAEYSADTHQMQGTSTSLVSLASHSHSSVGDLSTLVLDVLSFAEIGSSVAAGNASLQQLLVQALGKVSKMLSDVGALVGDTARGYVDADHAVAQSLGGGTATTATADDPLPDLISHHHRGDRGTDVRQLQDQLTAAGYDTHGTDGIWGHNTQQAVDHYLRDHPAPLPDGMVDPANWDPQYTSPNTHPDIVGQTRVGGKMVPTYDMTGHQPPTTAPAGNLNQWITDAKTVLTQNGVDTSSMTDADLRALIQHESSGRWDNLNDWDRNARNGIPSKGLMQTIDQTFNTYSVPGHRDVWNPVDNIVAGVRYGIQRYGSFDSIPGIASLHRGGDYRGY
jgi:peptidoglycan hydrolase-like protein with peptidoglycan-binding domain